MNFFTPRKIWKAEPNKILPIFHSFISWQKNWTLSCSCLLQCISLSFQSLQSRFSCHWEPCKLCMQSTRFSHGFHEMWGHYNVTRLPEKIHIKWKIFSKIYKWAQVLDHQLFQIKSSILEKDKRCRAAKPRSDKSLEAIMKIWIIGLVKKRWKMVAHSFSRPVIF